jgi:hypothetical protein
MQKAHFDSIWRNMRDTGEKSALLMHYMQQQREAVQKIIDSHCGIHPFSGNDFDDGHSWNES